MERNAQEEAGLQTRTGWVCAGKDIPLYNEIGADRVNMTFWKITLSYDGTAFYGWQVQPERPTVQGVLAAALEHITGERVLPQGSGRTDAGVHALGQVASFALAAPVPQENLMRALNRSLPQSIRVLRAEVVDESFHARHRAVRKIYEYRIFERKVETGSENSDAERVCSPFVAPFAWDCRWPLRIEPMEQAAAMLLGTHDFTSFAASDPDLAQRDELSAGPNPVKTVFASTVARENDLLRYRVTGSGFLHHMVRNIVGTLVDVGRGSLSPTDVPRILAARDRSAAGPTAPAQGLFLVQVEYDENVSREEELP
jgi:tRNA pseudouridine38-40 synthase